MTRPVFLGHKSMPLDQPLYPATWRYNSRCPKWVSKYQCLLRICFHPNNSNHLWACSRRQCSSSHLSKILGKEFEIYHLDAGHPALMETIVVETAGEATWDQTSAGDRPLLSAGEGQVEQLQEAIHLPVSAGIHRQTTSPKQYPGLCRYCRARRSLQHMGPFWIPQASSTSFKLQSFPLCLEELPRWAERDNHEVVHEVPTGEATMVAVGLIKGSTSFACSTEILLRHDRAKIARLPTSILGWMSQLLATMTTSMYEFQAVYDIDTYIARSQGI